MAVKDSINSLSDQEEHFVSENLTRLVYQKTVKPGDIVLDIGANRGDHTRDLSRLVGVSGKVHAFEPNVGHFLTLIGIGPNVRLWPAAAGDRMCMQTLHIPQGLDGWASLEDIASMLPEREFSLMTVPQITVDSVLDEIDASRVSFIKIDVESREKEAVFGMPELLQCSRSIVVLENMNDEIESAFLRLGYSVLGFGGDPWRQQALPFTNVVALPDEKKGEVAAWLPSAEEIQQTIGAARRFFSDGIGERAPSKPSMVRRVFAAFQR